MPIALGVSEMLDLGELFWQQIDMNSMRKDRTVLKKCLLRSVTLFSPLKIDLINWKGTG